MTYYTVPQATCYLRITKIRFECSEYIKACVEYIDKVNKKVIHTERNLKIPNKCFEFWEKHTDIGL